MPSKTLFNYIVQETIPEYLLIINKWWKIDTIYSSHFNYIYIYIYIGRYTRVRQGRTKETLKLCLLKNSLP